MLIGLHGRAGVGKDTVADYLVEHHRFTKRGFADALYEEVAEAFDVSVGWLKERSRKETPQRELALHNCNSLPFVSVVCNVRSVYDSAYHEHLSPRWILQQWGTNFRRSQDEHYWLNRWFTWYRHAPTRAVVPDVRFTNEAEFIRSRGGAIINIVREVPAVEAHVSEKPLSPYQFDFTIYNTSGVEHLRSAVDFYLQRTPRAI